MVLTCPSGVSGSGRFGRPTCGAAPRQTLIVALPVGVGGVESAMEEQAALEEELLHGTASQCPKCRRMFKNPSRLSLHRAKVPCERRMAHLGIETQVVRVLARLIRSGEVVIRTETSNISSLALPTGEDDGDATVLGTFFARLGREAECR